MELPAIREVDMPRSAHNGPGDHRSLRLRFYATLLAVDLSAIAAGFALAGLFRFGTPLHVQALTMVAAILPLFCVFNVASYVPETLDDWRQGVTRPIAALVIAMTIVLFLGFFLKASTELSRLMTGTGFVFSSVAIVAGRAVVGRRSRRTFGGSSLSRVLLCDDTDIVAPAGVRKITSDSIGFVGNHQHPVMLDRLARAIDGADSVYIGCSLERRAAWTTALQGSNRHVELLVPELNALGVIGIRQFAGIPTVLISSGQMRTRDELAKRALDLALVVPALLFLAPLLALVALAVKLDSAGPVFFVQQRVGRGNRLFNVFKFRSMRTDRCDHTGAISASRLDDRITRVGRIIRSTSIDELAQLFNILRGDMSFVGPRPHALGSLAGDTLFWEVDDRYHHRHACKPGLTGLAQVRGYRGATHQREDLVNRLRADLEYLNGWSVQRDLAILFATVRVVFYRDPTLATATVGRDDVHPVRKRRIGPVDITVTDLHAAVEDVIDAVDRRTGRIFSFCSMHTLNVARRAPALAAALRGATVFNDGIGIDVASKLLYGARFSHNLNSVNFTPKVLAALRRQTRAILIGRTTDVAAQAAANLSGKFANLVVVGTHHGLMDDAGSHALAERLRDESIDLVLVGTGNPDQELWAARYGERTGAVVLCVGAYLDRAADIITRAPLVMRHPRAEWVYRLAMEPRRTYRRYITGGIAFMAAILCERLLGNAHSITAPPLAPNDNRPIQSDLMGLEFGQPPASVSTSAALLQ